MVYAYVRVSTDNQTVENQIFEIKKFAEANKLKIGKWIEESISGTKSIVVPMLAIVPQERKLGKLLKQMKRNDILICSELSRLGRNLLMIMSILNECMEKNIKVWTIKDNYRLGKDISCKVLAFAFGLSAEIERNLISARTKEALARKKADGIALGRPIGSKNKNNKLIEHESLIREMLNAKIPKSLIGKRLNVHRQTLYFFIDEMNL